MSAITEMLNQYRPLQIQAAAESTGTLHAPVSKLLHAVTLQCERLDNPGLIDIEQVFEQDVFTIDDDYLGHTFESLMKIWHDRLRAINVSENNLLELVKDAARALTINGMMAGDVNAWDMNGLADIGHRLNRQFITSDNRTFQFNSDFAYWESGEEQFDMDSEGFPSNEHGEHIVGSFI